MDQIWRKVDPVIQDPLDQGLDPWDEPLFFGFEEDSHGSSDRESKPKGVPAGQTFIQDHQAGPFFLR